jgi:hypothetical protein
VIGDETRPTPNSPAVNRGLLAGCLLLAAGIVSQFALAAHLRPAGELSYPPLTGRFETLPLEVNDPATGQTAWRGVEMKEATEATRAKLPFAVDDLLIRAYKSAHGDVVRLYMVHSRVGEDRKHHPEVCVRDVSGAPEDLAFRREIPLSGEGRSAQRFRFLTGPGRSMVVYYWHYTPAPNPIPGQTSLQRLHQQIGVTAPSVTVQLSAAGDDPRTIEAIEKRLLPALDQAAHERVLPPGTRTGCDRIPIGLTRH